MSILKILSNIKKEPIADPRAIIKYDKVRFTVLTSRIIRMEYSHSGSFEDKASQIFWFRKQLVPDFETKISENDLEIKTEFLQLSYKKGDDGFTQKSLSIELKENGMNWHYQDKDYENLKGTIRTLDATDGKVPLENGLMSKNGWSLIDDSNSLVFNEDGWLEVRKEKEIDLYFFGYGKNYEVCLKDYCKIAGSIPLIPRWVLGNWWSRYWEYTQEEFKNLILEFKKREVPLSVSIIDMDWHIVKIKDFLKKHSKEDWTNTNLPSGWTGFTWNKDLFPDYKGLLKFLHEKGLKVALNIHPADGIYPHEMQYQDVANFMGINPKIKEPIKFDIINPKFCEAYFNFIYHPYEEDGVDFWWLDWQQETTTKLKGLDPLWWLNHISFHDLGRDRKKRPFTFSRWGGLGNHRYPIGFSGDTYSTWNSLSFLPYFTSTASNVGYTWWSHDLGGHMGGIGLDPELYVRWIQFGLFSPIFRPHSTKNPYNERLPWGFDENIFQIARSIIKLRHAFIPYIYSMAWKIHKESIPLIRPLYYLHPNDEKAYKFSDQYFFGSELLCSPFISKIIPEIGRCRQELWLPEGIWFNFFTGEYFEGGDIYAIYGKLDEIPVFAKAGAIIPLAHQSKKNFQWNKTSNPEYLDIVIFPGANNKFQLYEDDGETQDYLDGKYIITEFLLIDQKHALYFKINNISNGISMDIIPKERKYKIIFNGIKHPDEIKIQINEKIVEIQSKFFPNEDKLEIKGIKLAPMDQLEINLSKKTGKLISKRDRTVENVQNLLRFMEINSELKKYLDYRISDNIRDIKKFKKVLSYLAKGIITELTNPTEIEIFKKKLSTINAGNILECILLNDLKTLLKDQLFNINLNDNTSTRKVFLEIIRKSSTLNLLFSLKESQIKALIETFVAPIIFESFIMV